MVEKADAKSGISFGFKAKTDGRALQTKSVITDDTKDEVEETDFVKSVDGTNITSVKENTKKKKGPLVIPLIKKNNWRGKGASITAQAIESNDEKIEENSVKENADDDLTKLAAKELIQAAKRRENGGSDDDGKEDAQKIVPLLVENKIPDGFETDDKIDTALRPEQPTLEEYEQVPLEQFGLAVLRGMGWKEGDGIGKNKKNVKPIEANLRPKGMGLGADRSKVLQEKGNKKHRLKPGEERNEEETLDYKKGVHCVILKGAHKDLYATIEGVDDDSSRCVVKLSLSQQTVHVSQFSLKLVNKKEFDKYSRYLNKGKADEYREKHSNGADSPSLKKRRVDEKDGKSKEKKSKHSSSKYSSKQPKCWVFPMLRVKVIDRKFKDGRYYSSKVIVDDVLPDSIVCKTESGRLLEGLNEGQLESVIPREDKSHVMILSGEYKQEIGQMIERNKEREKVTVQLLCDRSILLTLHYDEVCEYTGIVHHLHDY